MVDFEKGEIIALNQADSQQKIAQDLAISQTTIESFLHRSQSRKSINNLPSSGRPQKKSSLTIHYLIQSAEAETKVPLAELQNATNIKVSERAIHRRLFTLA